jgi:LysR family transcriptional activator of nhaA
MMMLNFNHLRYFWAVAHEGNLTRAAEKLHVSQSALSIQIQKLEAQLGHALFERRGRQLLLTEAGQIALDHADAIFATGDELLGTLKERGDPVQRVLRVGALSTLSRNFQIGFLRPMLHRENVEVVISSGRLGDLLQALEAHQLDVVLVNAPPARDAATPFISHQIAAQPVSLIGTPQRLKNQKLSVEALLPHNPLVLPSGESNIRTGFDALADKLGLKLNVVAEVDDMAMLRLLAREDIGLAVVPPIVVKDELDNGRLIEAAQLPSLQETFYAVTLARRFPNPLLRSLIETGGA